MGPKHKEGKKLNAPNRKMVPMIKRTKVAPEMGKVASDGGCFFFAASDPLKARMAHAIRKRPASIALDRVAWYHGVLESSDAKLLPLFVAEELNAYKISVKI